MDSATVLRDVLGAGWIATADANQLLIDAAKLSLIGEHVATIANRIGQIQLLCNVRREDGDGPQGSDGPGDFELDVMQLATDQINNQLQEQANSEAEWHNNFDSKDFFRTLAESCRNKPTRSLTLEELEQLWNSFPNTGAPFYVPAYSGASND